MTKEYPLLKRNPLPNIDCEGYFGAVRKYDIHTGIDLYCDEGSYVYAMEDGIILGIDWFTGQFCGSPWWRDTKAIMVYGDSGTILYGEIDPSHYLKKGDKVHQGEVLGKVVRVLKNDKGKPTTMLHVELYNSVKYTPEWWKLGEDIPKDLKNPAHLLQSCSHNRFRKVFNAFLHIITEKMHKYG